MAKDVIVLGDERYNAVWLRTVAEDHAVKVINNDPSQVRNAWKQANGVSVRNYTKSEDKPKRKRVQKKED